MKMYNVSFLDFPNNHNHVLALIHLCHNGLSPRDSILFESVIVVCIWFVYVYLVYKALSAGTSISTSTITSVVISTLTISTISTLAAYIDEATGLDCAWAIKCDCLDTVKNKASCYQFISHQLWLLLKLSYKTPYK